MSKIQLRNWLKKLHSDTDGAISVETILILAIIAVPLLLVLILFRDKIKGWFWNQADQLNSGSPNDTGP